MKNITLLSAALVILTGCDGTMNKASTPSATPSSLNQGVIANSSPALNLNSQNQNQSPQKSDDGHGDDHVGIGSSSPSSTSSSSHTSSSTATSSSTSSSNAVIKDVLINGSFEILNTSVGNDNRVVQNTLVSKKSWDNYNQVLGWFDEVSDGIELWGSGNEGVSASNGNIFIELKGNRPDKISQNFIASGQALTLAFDIYARTGSSIDCGFSVLLDDKVIFSAAPAHQFWKTYEVALNLSEGSHKLSFQASSLGKQTEGALLDNVRLLSGHVVPPRTAVGVETILMALSAQSPVNVVHREISDAIQYVMPVSNPRILMVKSQFDMGQLTGEYAFLQSQITSLGYNLTVMTEPLTGLTLDQTSGYDVVWFVNPSWYPRIQATIATLYTMVHQQRAGLILSGDDMAHDQLVTMDSLTLMKYQSNGTSACGQAINPGGYVYEVAYDDAMSNYSYDIDAALILDPAVQVVADAATTIPECSLRVPAITRYRTIPGI